MQDIILSPCHWWITKINLKKSKKTLWHYCGKEPKLILSFFGGGEGNSYIKLYHCIIWKFKVNCYFLLQSHVQAWMTIWPNASDGSDLRDCGRLDTVMATWKKLKNLPSCPEDATNLSNDHKILSFINKNEFGSIKNPSQRNNISPRVTFLKIVLIFSRKKIGKGKNLPLLFCVAIPTSADTLSAGSRRTLRFFLKHPCVPCGSHVCDLLVLCSLYEILSSNAITHTLTC